MNCIIFANIAVTNITVIITSHDSEIFSLIFCVEQNDGKRSKSHLYLPEKIGYSYMQDMAITFQCKCELTIIIKGNEKKEELIRGEHA